MLYVIRVIGKKILKIRVDDFRNKTLAIGNCKTALWDRPRAPG